VTRLDNNTGFRKNIATPIPPVEGGFALVRTFTVLLVVVLAVTLWVAAITPSGGAFAQTANHSTAMDKDSAVQEVVTLDSEIKSVNNRLSALEQKSEQLQGRISAINDQVAAKRKRLSGKRHALADRARNIYVNGRSNTLVMLLSSQNISEFVKRTDYVTKINQRDTDLVVSIKREESELEARLSDLKKRKQEVDGVASEQRSKKARLVSARAERETVIASAGEQASAVEQQSSSVETKMSDLNPRYEGAARSGGGGPQRHTFGNPGPRGGLRQCDRCGYRLGDQRQQDRPVLRHRCRMQQLRPPHRQG
jgi:peptidoglycan hydrolase CwlO-like protein